MKQEERYNLQDSQFVEGFSVIGAPLRSRERDADGAPTSNRCPVKYGSLGCSVDTIEIGFSGSFRDEFLDLFFQRLEDAKFFASEAPAYVTFKGSVFKVLPKGAKSGRVSYSYWLQFHGLDILIHKDPDFIQPVRIKVGAIALMRFGYQGVKRLINLVLDKLDFVNCGEIISRIDVQLMLSGVSPADVLNEIQAGDVVTTCRGSFNVIQSLKDLTVQTVWLKSRTAELCIYDKLSELEKVSSEYFQAFLSRFGSNLQYKKLTRFEFRFKSEYLKNYGIRTFKDFEELQGDLLENFTFEWFRIIDRPKVRGHEREQKLSNIWALVRREINENFPLISKVVKVVKEKTVKASRLIKQAVGCLSSAFAMLYKNSDVTECNIKEFFSSFSDDLIFLTGQKTYEKEVLI